MILIRIISDVKERKITLLKLEKAEMSHRRRLLRSVVRDLAVYHHKPGITAEAPM